MSELKLVGKIKTILDKQSGTSKIGNEWVKQSFVISNNDGYEGKEQIFCFELFGDEKVSKFNEYNSVGKEVEVSFNIKCNEWTKDGKTSYFTSLDAWKVFSVSQDSTSQDTATSDTDDLPF